MTGPDAPDARLDRWLDALVDRHTRDLTRSEFLKSVRALSARYVEQRATLSSRSALDSAGKRAAFAAFYAPLHLVTVLAAARRLDLPVASADRILDLGCGTGVAGAGWALAQPTPPALEGIDESAWALGEALWNWRALGLDGRTRRADLVTAATRLDAEGRRRGSSPPAIVLGWAVNELAPAARGRLLSQLTTLVERGSALLIIEPIARTLTPWWAEWVERLSPHGAESHDWKFDIALPGRLAEIDHEAGFRREGLSARTLSCRSRGGAPFLH